MKTAGVIGGNDFIGCEITLKLLSEDYRVKILVPKFSWHTKPLINTGLMAGENLSYSLIDMENQFQMEDFVRDCDFLIHCGRPYELACKTGVGALYIPLISNTGNILKSLIKVHYAGKIIFLTSVAAYNHFDSRISSFINQNEHAKRSLIKEFSEKAFYHSTKVIDKLLNDFPDDQIEIIVVAPVLVSNNLLFNSRESTLAGLRYMFTNKIDHDRIFLHLMRRKLMNTMVNVNELPELVFAGIEEYGKSRISSPMLSF